MCVLPLALSALICCCPLHALTALVYAEAGAAAAPAPDSVLDMTVGQVLDAAAASLNLTTEELVAGHRISLRVENALGDALGCAAGVLGSWLTGGWSLGACIPSAVDAATAVGNAVGSAISQATGTGSASSTAGNTPTSTTLPFYNLTNTYLSTSSTCDNTVSLSAISSYEVQRMLQIHEMHQLHISTSRPPCPSCSPLSTRCRTALTSAAIPPAATALLMSPNVGGSESSTTTHPTIPPHRAPGLDAVPTSLAQDCRPQSALAWLQFSQPSPCCL